MTKAEEAQEIPQDEHAEYLPWVTPIILELSPSLSALVDDGQEHFFHRLLPTMLQVLFDELGVVFPDLHVHSDCAHLPEGMFCIKIKEVVAGYDVIPEGSVFLYETLERLEGLKIEGQAARHPAHGGSAAWIPASKQEIVEQAGYVTWSPQEYLILSLSCTLRRSAYRFVGIQEVHEQLQKLRLLYPMLVDTVVPGHLTLAELTEVLRRLVEEEVSLRNLRDILEALAQWRGPERDPFSLTEWVRASFRDYLTYKYIGNSGVLMVYLLGDKLEYKFRQARKKSEDFLALDQEEAQEILNAIREEIGELPSTAQRPVLLTSSDIRRDVRQLTQMAYPDIVVLSHSELDFKYTVQPLSTIDLPKRRKSK